MQSNTTALIQRGAVRTLGWGFSTSPPSSEEEKQNFLFGRNLPSGVSTPELLHLIALCVFFFLLFYRCCSYCVHPLELACLHTPTVCLFAAFSPTPHHSHFAVPVHNSRTFANLWEGHSPLLLTPCMNNGTEYWLNINKCFLKDKEKIWFIK